jgi:hypothetical protein
VTYWLRVLLALLWLGPRQTAIISRYRKCRACGHHGCDLAWDEVAKMVQRRCRTCKCIEIEPPIVPVDEWAPTPLKIE